MIRLALVLLALHLLAVFQHFPLRHANADDPLASGDLSFYLGSGWDAAASGRLFGYSPSYLAGYPQGLWMSLGRKGYESALLIPLGSPVSRFYAAVVLLAALPPFLLGLAARAGGADWRIALQTAAAAAVIFQLADPLAYFWTFGNVAFPCACSLVVLSASLLAQPTPRRALLAGLIGALAIWIHTLAAVPLAIAMVSVALAAHRGGSASKKIMIALSISATVIAAIIVPSHWYYLSYLDLRVPMRMQPLQSGVRYLVMDFFNDRAYRHPLDRRVWLHVLIVLAAWQCLSEWRSRQIQTCGLGIAGLLVLAFNYLAGHLLVEIQPYRFVVSAELLFVLPATLGLRRLIDAVRQANRPGRLAFLAAALVILPAITGTLVDLPSREKATGLTLSERICSQWVKHYHSAGRVACEPAALGNLLPHLAGCQTLGGGISEQAVIPQRWAAVSNANAFGMPLAEITPEQFLRQCRRLNVRLLIVQSETLEKLVKQTPAKLEVIIGDLKIYSLAAEPSPGIWPGSVEASPNRIVIHDAPPGRFVIDYHYLRGLAAPAGIELAPAPAIENEAPFIQIDNPQGMKEIVLIFSG